MDVMDYCKGMEMELTAWKAKLYDLTRKIDKLGSADKEKILPNVEDLHMYVEEIKPGFPDCIAKKVNDSIFIERCVDKSAKVNNIAYHRSIIWHK